MNISPVLKALRRHKTAVTLIVLQIAVCCAILCNSIYLIKARVEDMAAYRAFLGETLVNLPGVRETRTYAVMEEVKCTTHLPLW